MCNAIGMQLEFDDADRPNPFRNALTFELFFNNIRNISTFLYVAADQLLPEFLLLHTRKLNVFTNLEYIVHKDAKWNKILPLVIDINCPDDLFLITFN